MEAGLADPPLVALRINSDIIRWRQDGKRVLKTKIPSAPGDKYVGLVMLFSTENGAPLAIFPDGVVQRMRVASSSALAARYLAREDVSTLALFGSGWQAGSHLPAMCAVRPIKQVKVYSTTRANREAFVKEMAPKSDCRRDSRGEPGGSGGRRRDYSRQDELFIASRQSGVGPSGRSFDLRARAGARRRNDQRVDRLVIHGHQHAPENYIAGFGDECIHAHDAIDIIRKGPQGARESKIEDPFWLAAPELRDLVTGRAPGRNDQESTCFLNKYRHRSSIRCRRLSRLLRSDNERNRAGDSHGLVSGERAFLAAFVIIRARMRKAGETYPTGLAFYHHGLRN